jgi:hypothetical protein
MRTRNNFKFQYQNIGFGAFRAKYGDGDSRRGIGSIDGRVYLHEGGRLARL